MVYHLDNKKEGLVFLLSKYSLKGRRQHIYYQGIWQLEETQGPILSSRKNPYIHKDAY